MLTLPLVLGGMGLFAHARELTVEDAVATASRQNPDLAAARFRIEEARGRLRAAGVRPNPEIHVEAEHNARFREGSLMVGWVQKFPASAKLRLEKEVSQAMLDAAAAEVQVAERTLQIKVRRLAVQLLALDAEEALRKRQTANAEELATAAAKRAERGEGSGLEAAQFELEARQLNLDALHAEALRSEAVGELRTLLALALGESISIRGSLASPRVSETAPAAESRPEYAVATQQETAAQRAVELEKTRRKGEISGGIFAGVERTEDAPEGFENEGLIGIRLTIPLSFWNKNEGKIQEAEAAASRAVAERKAVTQRINSENDSAKDRLHRLAKVVTEIESKLLPIATELETKLHEAYEKSRLPSITDVLRAREKRLQLERSRLEALRDFHLLRVQAGLLTGETKPNMKEKK